MSGKGPRRSLIKDFDHDLGLADTMIAFDEDLEQHKFWSPEKQPKPVASAYSSDDSTNELRINAMNAITHARHLANARGQAPASNKQQTIPQQVGFEVEEKPASILSRRLFD